MMYLLNNYLLNNLLFVVFGLAFAYAITLAGGHLKNPSKPRVKVKKHGKLTHREWVDLLVFDPKTYYKLRDKYLSDPRNVGHCQYCPVYKPGDTMQRCEGNCWVSVHLSSTDDDDE